MNQHIANSLQVDLSRVIIGLAGKVINPHNLINLIVKEEWMKTSDEDLLDYVCEEDVDQLKWAMKITCYLIKNLSPAHLNALHQRIIELGVVEEIECDNCGGILLISCSCEG